MRLPPEVLPIVKCVAVDIQLHHNSLPSIVELRDNFRWSSADFSNLPGLRTLYISVHVQRSVHDKPPALLGSLDSLLPLTTCLCLLKGQLRELLPTECTILWTIPAEIRRDWSLDVGDLPNNSEVHQFWRTKHGCSMKNSMDEAGLRFS